MTCNIILKLITRFDQTTLEEANFHFAFCLVCVEFLLMSEFNFNKVEKNFNSQNLTWCFISLSEDLLFLVILFSKTNLFCHKIIWTISFTSDEAYIITSLNNLFTQFPKANYYFLVSNHVETFSCNYVTIKL